MKKTILFILIGLGCCTIEKKEAKENDRVETTDENDFVKYISILPRLKLPYEINCEQCCDHPEIRDNELINKFKPQGSTIVGVIDRTENRVSILVTYPADMIFPSIKVYDLKGNLTGEMDFMTSYCGGEPGYYGKQYFKINTDFSISTADTSCYFTLDSLTNEIADTTKLEITKKEYKINDKGQVEEDNIIKKVN
jgi:hypothetical protein